MKKYVTDTMALILHLEKRKMPFVAKMPFEEAEKGHAEVYIPAMVLVEIGYLAEKDRIGLKLHEVEAHINKYENYKICELNWQVIKTAFAITDIKELHDRLIAGNAMMLDIELISNDPIIENSIYVKTIWK
jgi:PIN domain nuclease of toxin-antitoxin system